MFLANLAATDNNMLIDEKKIFIFLKITTHNHNYELLVIIGIPTYVGQENIYKSFLISNFCRSEPTRIKRYVCLGVGSISVFSLHVCVDDIICIVINYYRVRPYTLD